LNLRFGIHQVCLHQENVNLESLEKKVGQERNKRGIREKGVGDLAKERIKNEEGCRERWIGRDLCTGGY